MKRRAVVVCIEDKSHLISQFYCLYESFKYINCNDTDIVVFGSKGALPKVPDDCIKIETKMLSDLPEWSFYPFINSIGCITDEKSNFLENYEYILRTDADTFLTPAWNNFSPPLYTTGRGLYSNNDDVRSKVKQVADKFGLTHKGIYNIGSTHYGKPSIMREVCKLAMKIAHYLATVEFKEQKGTWPGWFYGVITMYSMEIASNHILESINIDASKLDYPSTSDDSIDDHPHIHCWHTQNMFSKFDFFHGQYDNLWSEGLPRSNVKDYCLYTALKSKYSPTSSLAQIISQKK